MNTLASWGEQLARALLHEPLPRRWAHVQGVAARARGLAPVLGADAELLEAAAWLHDIGYAPGLAITGLHQLDGARYLRDAQHADAMLCRLVAHHSCAIIEAGERGPAAFDQIHTGVAGLTWHEQRSGVWAGAALEYGSGTPAALPNVEGQETRIRLPEHLVANFTLGIDLFQKEQRRVSLQFNLENATNRVFAIAKESEFTPIQFSPPRFLSGSLRFHF
jgi:hypothetical protein